MATLTELIERRNQLVVEIADSGGMVRTTVDGMSVEVDQSAQLKAIDSEIARLQSVAPTSAGPFGFLRQVELKPPGGGGR